MMLILWPMPELGSREGARLLQPLGTHSVSAQNLRVLPKNQDQFLKVLGIHRPPCPPLPPTGHNAVTGCIIQFWVAIQGWEERLILVLLGLCVCVWLNCSCLGDPALQLSKILYSHSGLCDPLIKRYNQGLCLLSPHSGLHTAKGFLGLSP